MPYRAATLLILAFWLVMMALLVRLETHPEGTDILDVPVPYVMRLMFRGGQQSFLTIMEQDKQIGSISLRPSMTPDGARKFDFSGTLSLQLSLSGSRQRINFNGGMNMDPADKLIGFAVDVALQQPRYRLSVQGDAARGQLTYQVREDNILTMSQSLPLNSTQLLPALLQSVGQDPHAIPMITPNITAPEITAREAQVTVHGEQVQVYKVAASEAGSQIGALYITQMGQIVLARTSFGYTLSTEEFQ